MLGNCYFSICLVALGGWSYSLKGWDSKGRWLIPVTILSRASWRLIRLTLSICSDLYSRLFKHMLKSSDRLRGYRAMWKILREKYHVIVRRCAHNYMPSYSCKLSMANKKWNFMDRVPTCEAKVVTCTLYCCGPHIHPEIKWCNYSGSWIQLVYFRELNVD